MASGFDVDLFASNPSKKAFKSCRKAELILLANFYGIDISELKLKNDIKQFVSECLVQFLLEVKI